MNLAEQLLAMLAERPGAPSSRSDLLTWAGECDHVDPPGISRFLFALFKSRADLQQEFLGVYLDESARLRFLLWAHHFAAQETGAPVELVPAVPPGVASLEPASTGEPVRRQRGVGVLGYLRAVQGLGAAARRIVTILDLLGEPLRLYPYDHTNATLLLDRSEWDPRQGPGPVRPRHGALSSDDLEAPDVLVSVLGAHELALVPRILGERTLAGAKRVALFFWETDELPDEFREGFADLSEVWVTSEYTAAAARSLVPEACGVHVIPLGATVCSSAEPRAVARDRWSQRLGVLPTTTVTAQVFDYASGVERKNPSALVQAWCSAFPDADAEQRVLVFKTIGADEQLAGTKRLHESVSGLGRTDILFVDEALSTDDQSSFLDRVDVIASLHRAEGYGLVLLEAMHRGIPVIASGYSGNLAFMNGTNSWLVPCSPSVLQADDGPYRAGSAWGEPDVAAAAVALLEVLGGLSGLNPMRAEQVALRVAAARVTARPLVDGSAAATFLRLRLAAIRAKPR